MGGGGETSSARFTFAPARISTHTRTLGSSQPKMSVHKTIAARAFAASPPRTTYADVSDVSDTTLPTSGADARNVPVVQSSQCVAIPHADSVKLKGV